MAVDAMLDNLEKMLASGKDSPMLRLSLGQAYLKQGEPAVAADHLRAAVEQDPDYSAAWKLLGRALVDAERPDEAAEAFDRGIAVAEQRGDLQAAKEMRVFRKRLRRD